MSNITPFVEGAKLIDKTALDGVSNLVKMVLSVTGTSLLQNITSWLTGGSSMKKFASELVGLGNGLKGFSDAVTGISPETINAGVDAATKLGAMSESLPKIGGIVALLGGEIDIKKFGKELPGLGRGLKGFSDSVNGIVPESVTAAADAAKALAEMTDTLPNEGGMIAWFTGTSSVSKFSFDLIGLGTGLKGFADRTSGITPESVSAAATAAKHLAEMADTIPNQNGMAQWFTGTQSVSKFAGELPKLGKGLKSFSDSVSGIVPENVKAGAEAAKALADMSNVIPKTGGFLSLFTGKQDISSWAANLPALGVGLKGFSDSLNGIVPENITAGATAAKSLGDMTAVIPKETGHIIAFGNNLRSFGTNLSAYFNATNGITAEHANTMTSVINSVKEVTNVNASAVKSVAESIVKLTEAITGTKGINEASTSGFVAAVKNLATASVDSFVKTFEDLATKMSNIGKTAIEAFSKGVKDNTKTAKSAGTTVSENTAIATKDAVGEFEDAGKCVVQGFANGISANSYLAEAKARAMAKAAAKAAEEELDINSPSKVFRAIGTSVPEGFAQGIGRMSNVVGASVKDMSVTAVDGLKDSLSNIADRVNSDMDTEPTIRPVLDLSNVESGVRRLSGMFNVGASVGVMANVGAINAGMSRVNQNGSGVTNVSNKSTNNTYIIDGVTYDDGSNVAKAMEEIVHAARVERRT